MSVDLIVQRFNESSAVLEKAGKHLSRPLEQAAAMILASLRAGGGVLVMGNGGSAADAQHIACELVGRFLKERRSLRAEALTTDSSVLTCLANDYSFERIFARQIEGKGRAGDVVVALTTSGNSANVVEGLKTARAMGLRTIAFTGEGGGQCAGLADVLLDVPSRSTPRIQEAHAAAYHVLCELIEQGLD